MGQGAGSRVGTKRFQAVGQLDSTCNSPTGIAALATLNFPPHAPLPSFVATPAPVQSPLPYFVILPLASNLIDVAILVALLAGLKPLPSR
jgi:hypothetical protein